ncbi:MAG: hypothetical protein KatS3mg122_2195 [Caldimonas sp.]|nr:MAG: hypothetical protein KatS3mg122_2195 [Caldimonas sp.]
MLGAPLPVECRVLRLVVPAFALLFLAACASGGPPKRLFPPELRAQELRLDGETATLQLRLQSFSTVPSEWLAYDLRLELAGQPAARLRGSPGIDVLPQAAETFPVALALDPAALERVRSALANGTALRYRLHGTVTLRPNGRASPVDYGSALSPVPGLEGVLR